MGGEEGALILIFGQEKGAYSKGAFIWGVPFGLKFFQSSLVYICGPCL